jgi:hypothetical protein
MTRITIILLTVRMKSGYHVEGCGSSLRHFDQERVCVHVQFPAIERADRERLSHPNLKVILLL